MQTGFLHAETLSTVHKDAVLMSSTDIPNFGPEESTKYVGTLDKQGNKNCLVSVIYPFLFLCLILKKVSRKKFCRQPHDSKYAHVLVRENLRECAFQVLEGEVTNLGKW